MNEVNENNLLLDEDLKLDAIQNPVSTEEILFEDLSKRSENTKHFRLKNGHFMAAVYNKPIHFKDPESGEFRDLADRFLETEQYYEADTGSFKARFPKKEGKGKFVSVEKNGASVQWRYLPKTSKRKNPLATLFQKEQKHPTHLPQFPHLKYEKEESQTDLEYQITDRSVKENIILTKCPKDPTFRFELKLEGVKAVLTEDKTSVKLYENNVMSDTPLFVIPPITMMDAVGVESTEAHYELAETDGTTVLSVCVNPEWLESPYRVYPVTIDPQVALHQANKTVFKIVNLSSGGYKSYTAANLLVGKKESNEYRIYAGFNFPSLPEGARISKAEVVLHQNQYSGNGLYDAYQIATSWDLSSISWANQPMVEPLLLDTVESKYRSATDEVCIDVTFPITSYYKSGQSFKGIVLKQKTYSATCGEDNDECTAASQANDEEQYLQFYSSEQESDYMPSLRVEYSLVDEYVDHQQQEQFQVGSAGVGSVNLATGKLTFIHEDFAASTGPLPITLSHIYRSDRVEYKSQKLPFGNGWLLSACQTLTVKNTSEEIFATYQDAQGRSHYFPRTNNYTETIDGKEQTWYCDMRGLGLSFNGTDTVRDEKENTLKFSDGKLVRFTDTNQNYNNYTYENGHLVSIEDNQGNSVTLNYENHVLSSIVDFKNRVTRFYYDSYHNLTQIEYPDGTSTLFTFTGDTTRAKLVRITDPQGTVYDITHELEPGDFVRSRVVSITKSGTKSVSGSAITPETPVNGGGIDIEYRGRSTAVTDRLTHIRTVYSFDESGRPNFSYEDLQLNSTLSPSEITVTDLRQYETITDSKAKKETSGKYTMVKAGIGGTEVMHPNYLVNGSFNATSAETKQPEGWTVYGVYGECRDYVVDESYLPGYHSYKFDNTNIRAVKRMSQTVDVCQEECLCGKVLVASAWAKASDPVNTLSGKSDAKFELKAVLTYSDGKSITRSAQFDCTCKDWQYVAVPLEVPPTKTPVSVEVVFNFSGNNGTCLVSNLRLTETSGVYTTVSHGTFSDEEIFGESIEISRIVSTYNEIEGTMVYYDKNLDAVKTMTTKIQPNYCFFTDAKYDTKHRPVKTMDYRGLITEYTYDEFGHVEKQVTYHKDKDSEKMISQWAYDSDTGNLWREYDSRGTHLGTGYYYDSTGELLNRRIDLNGQNYTYTYNSANDLQTSVTAVNASCACEDIVNGFSYVLHRLTQITHNGFNYDFEYDPLGRKKSVKAGGKTLATYAYANGETSTVTTNYENGHTSSVTADSRGNPILRTENGTDVSCAEYDKQGNLVKTVDKIRNICYNYSYNKAGDLEFVEQRNATDNAYIGKKTYAYLQNRHLFSIQDQELDQTYYPVYEKQGDHYFPDNAVKGISLSGKFRDIVERDGLRRASVRTLTLDGETSPLMEETYGYLTGIGRQTNYVSDFTNSLANETLSYTYDKSGNIETVSGKNGLLFRYTYDGLNQLIHEENYQQSKRYSYTYDCGGNITERKTYQLVSGIVSELLSTDTYEYASDWKDFLISYNGQSITYDDIGNPLTYKGNALTWARGRKLVQYGNNTFAYDASGIRYQKNNITYTLDGSKIVKETDGNRTLVYYYGTNGVVGFNYSGTDYYYRKNLQGDVIEIYREDGVLVAGYEYDAWGKILRVNEYNNTGIGAINPFRYRSYYYDTETGLYYVKSRYYDPEIGRFINADDVVYLGADGSILSYNLFAYCKNNSVMGYDPTGHWDWGVVTDFVSTAGSVLLSGVVGTYVGAKTLLITGSPGKATAAGITAGAATFGACNNVVNAVYYNYIADGEHSLEEDDKKSTYVDRYVTRWERLNYTKAQTEQSTYNFNAWMYCSEYDFHMHVWNLTSWAEGKDIFLLSRLAGSAEKAEVDPKNPLSDFDYYMDEGKPFEAILRTAGYIATGILGI